MYVDPSISVPIHALVSAVDWVMTIMMYYFFIRLLIYLSESHLMIYRSFGSHSIFY